MKHQVDGFTTTVLEALARACWTRLPTDLEILGATLLQQSTNTINTLQAYYRDQQPVSPRILNKALTALGQMYRQNYRLAHGDSKFSLAALRNCPAYQNALQEMFLRARPRYWNTGDYQGYCWAVEEVYSCFGGDAKEITALAWGFLDGVYGKSPNSVARQLSFRAPLDFVRKCLNSAVIEIDNYLRKVIALEEHFRRLPDKLPKSY